MTDKLKGMLIAAIALVALAAGGAAIATAAAGGQGASGTSGSSEAAEEEGTEVPDDDAGESEFRVDDQAAAERASSAALEAAGDGKVTEVERSDDGGSGYEIEVKRSDGSYGEVGLDGGFDVTSVEKDDD